MDEKDNTYQTGLWLAIQMGKLLDLYHNNDRLELERGTLWEEEFDCREVNYP